MSGQLEILRRQLSDISLKQNALNLRSQGFLNLYNAACLEGNHSDMESFRAQLMSVQDQILDNTAIQFMLTRQIIELGGSAD